MRRNQSLNKNNYRPKFGGHEKFAFRFAWLKKGFDAVIEDPEIFSKDEALIVLGVGKNMVRSIRYWCLATGFIEEDNSINKKHAYKPTMVGEKLLSNGGWDPYLEDFGSLWLIHWFLANNLQLNLVWHLLFSVYLETEFTKNNLQKFILSRFEKLGINTTIGTVNREVDVFIRTYVPGQIKSRKYLEESLDCPLTELELIKFLDEDGVYQFNIGQKNSLPLGVYGFSLLNFLSKIIENRQTVSIDECIYNQNSPGQVFKLDENTTFEYLEQLELITNGKLIIQETAGLAQAYLHESLRNEIADYSITLLETHYESK